MSNSESDHPGTDPELDPAVLNAGLPLRLFQPTDAESAYTNLLRELPDICQAFEDCTGWALRYVEETADGSRGKAQHNDTATGEAAWSAILGSEPARAGQLRIELVSAPRRQRNRTDKSSVEPRSVDIHCAVELAGHWAALLNQLFRTQGALWEREAELAAAVPLVPHPQEDDHLALRLEAVLKVAAEATTCQASGLYLLSEDTTSLKLRASWGLPASRLVLPARPLADCMADLEVLSGHAVVVENPNRALHWHPPEDFPAAACVPIASATQIFGTLWVFSERERKFGDRETNLLEIVGGRVSAELERAVLLSETRRLGDMKKMFRAASDWQRDELPSVLPPMEGWDLSGWTQCAGDVGGALYDWMPLENDRLAVIAVHAARGGMEGALLATSLRSLFRAHAEFTADPGELLRRVNRSLWTSSPGDKHAHAFLAVLNPSSGQMHFATAGTPAIAACMGGKWNSLPQQQPPLGMAAGAAHQVQEAKLSPGDFLVAYVDGALPREVRDGLASSDLHELMQNPRPRRAEELCRRLQKYLGSGRTADTTAVVIARRSPTTTAFPHR